MTNERTDFHLFIQENGTFLLSFFGVLSAGLGYILVFCLKSRCSELNCCGVRIIRTPIPIDQLNNVNLELNDNNNRAEIPN